MKETTTPTVITSLDDLIQKSAVPVTVHWPPNFLCPKCNGQKPDEGECAQCKGKGFLVPERQIAITGRRLRGSEESAMRLLLSSVIPKELPPENPGGEPRYDLRDPDYQARAMAVKCEAKCYALYCCFAPIRDGVKKAWAERAPEKDKGNEPPRPFIVEIVDGMDLDGQLLELMYQKVTSDVGDLLRAHVDFI